MQYKCDICGKRYPRRKNIPLGDIFCSKECLQVHRKKQEKSKVIKISGYYVSDYGLQTELRHLI